MRVDIFCTTRQPETIETSSCIYLSVFRASILHAGDLIRLVILSVRSWFIVDEEEQKKLTGVHCHGKDELVKLAVIVIKVIFPDSLDVSCVYPTMAIRAVLDEHHGR